MEVCVWCTLFNGISFDLRPAGWQITMWTIHETAQKVEMRLIMHKGLHGTNSQIIYINTYADCEPF